MDSPGKKQTQQDHFRVKLHSKQTKKLPKKGALRGKGKERFRLQKATYVQLKKTMDYYQTLTTLRTRRYNVGKAVIKSRGPGIFPGYYERGPWLLLLENRTKIEPKEIPSCLIPRLLVVFTRQLEILVTTLCGFGCG